MKVVIVPSHNQSKHIKQIIRSYENQTLRPDFVLFVFDRCTDDSVNIAENIISELNFGFIVKDDGESFSAGMTRDYGVSYIEQHFPNYEMILFTDGDCYPNETVIQDHYENCMLRKTPLVSCGRRMMQNESGTFEEDERMDIWANGYSFTNRNSRVLLSRKTTLESIFTYSCNLAFNKSAIELCKWINFILSNTERVFNPEFDGSWGGEDNFISDCLYRTGNYILLTHHRSCVYHQWHIPAPKDNNSMKWNKWHSLSNKLESSIINNVLEGPVTIFERNRFIVEPFGMDTFLNNVYKVVYNSTDKTNEMEIMFHSRNVKVLPATEDRPKKRTYHDIEVDKQYDISAFRKCYLSNTEIEIDEDIGGFVYRRNKDSGCSYCRLSK